MKIAVVWDAGLQEFKEVEVGGKPTPRQYERRRYLIASMIVDEGLTLRQIADVLGIHNANVYRAVVGRVGGKFSDIPSAWAGNKRLAGPRAHATRKLRQRGIFHG